MNFASSKWCKIRLDNFNYWPIWNEERATCKDSNFLGYTFVMREE